MDNLNRMIFREIWETRKDFDVYFKFREGEGQDDWLAQIISSLAEEPKFSWSEVQGSWQ